MSFLGSAAGAVGGAIVGGIVGHYSAKQNAALSRQNWIYQQSNAHQLEVQDLKKAGLNPILSATNSQMAGMSPVSGSDYGAGQAFSSAIQAALDRKSKQELQANDLAIERLKLENDKLRIGIQRDEADAQIAKWKSEGKLLDIQADYTSSKKINEANESAMRVRYIANQISNENKLTDAEVAKLRSGISLDNATIDKLAADTKLSIERSNLTYWEKTQLITNLSDSTAQLKRMTAKQQLEYLSNDFGEVSHKFGYGLKLVSPIQGVGFGSNGYSNVRF